MWPLLILGAVGAGVYYYASRSGPIDREGPPETKCKLSGELFETYVKKLDPATGGLIMAAWGNPMATKAGLLKLAVEVRKLKDRFPEADLVADCLEVRAEKGA
jgi:hypothetical protein